LAEAFRRRPAKAWVQVAMAAIVQCSRVAGRRERVVAGVNTGPSGKEVLGLTRVREGREKEKVVDVSIHLRVVGERRHCFQSKKKRKYEIRAFTETEN
jgi:hypothetical protein